MDDLLLKVKLARISLVAVFLPIVCVFAEGPPDEVERLRSASIDAISPTSQTGHTEFLQLANRLAQLGEYDFLGMLLQRTMSETRPEFSEVVVTEVLAAPIGAEFTPDLAESLIDYIDFLLRDSRPRDEIATGRRLVSHRIAVVLEDGLGISSSQFDYEKSSVALKYIDDAKQAIVRLRRDGEVCRITEEVVGARSHQRARELIIERDQARASEAKRDAKKDLQTRDRKTAHASVDAAKADDGEQARVAAWGIAGGTLVAATIAVFLALRKRR